MSKLITITSGKGGVGKTTTSVNLGFALNSFGKEVVIVDANLTTPNIGLHLGAPIVPVNLNHVLLGKAKVGDAIYEHSSGTKVIPSSLSSREMRNIDYSGLKDVAKKLKKDADFIIYDCAAGLGNEATKAIEAADEIIIVTNPEITAVTDALKTIKMAQDLKKEVKGVIVTRVRGRKGEMPLSNIRDMLGMPILGVIPEDKNAHFALNHKMPMIELYPHSHASRNYRRIAAKIADVDLNDHYRTPLIVKVFGKK